MTCSWRWFIHPETAISRKQNGPKTLWGFKAHCRDCRPMVKPSRIHADPVFEPYANLRVDRRPAGQQTLSGASELRQRPVCDTSRESCRVGDAGDLLQQSPAQVSASVVRFGRDSRKPGCRRVFRMRFSASTYSLFRSSSWLTTPVT
jgi:hypothetical protein